MDSKTAFSITECMKIDSSKLYFRACSEHFLYNFVNNSAVHCQGRNFILE